MVFENDKLRIGSPAITESLFLMPDPKKGQRKGKRFEIPEYLTNLGLNACTNSVPGEWHPLPTRPIMGNFGKIVSNLM